MRLLTALSIIYVSLFTSSLAATVSTVPGAPPVMTQTFSSKPLVAINSAVTSTRMGLATTAATTSSSVTMKLLVVDGNTSEIGYQAITTFLNRIGVPYDAVVLSNIAPDASGNRLSALT